MQGVIFDIKHYAIHDGPGIRQTIFFKGCALGCWWCHNPESRSREPFTYQKKDKIDGREVIVKETVGKKYSINELMEIIGKDMVFFEESGGGVTFSGGEPLQQYNFLLEVLKACKKKDIHTCLDTTGL
ncbi:MAG: glycyl-radical enzyme activating protein, partial [Marinilabiliales bacterium]